MIMHSIDKRSTWVIATFSKKSRRAIIKIEHKFPKKSYRQCYLKGFVQGHGSTFGNFFSRRPVNSFQVRIFQKTKNPLDRLRLDRFQGQPDGRPPGVEPGVRVSSRGHNFGFRKRFHNVLQDFISLSILLN